MPYYPCTQVATPLPYYPCTQVATPSRSTTVVPGSFPHPLLPWYLAASPSRSTGCYLGLPHPRSTGCYLGRPHQRSTRCYLGGHPFAIHPADVRSILLMCDPSGHPADVRSIRPSSGHVRYIRPSSGHVRSIHPAMCDPSIRPSAIHPSGHLRVPLSAICGSHYRPLLVSSAPSAAKTSVLYARMCGMSPKVSGFVGDSDPSASGESSVIIPNKPG